MKKQTLKNEKKPLADCPILNKHYLRLAAQTKKQSITTPKQEAFGTQL